MDLFPIATGKKKQNKDYFIKKSEKYLKYLQCELTEDEKKFVMNKLKYCYDNLESLKKAEELSIEHINKSFISINKEQLENQYKAYIANKNVYFKLKSQEIPENFRFVYECYEYVNEKFKLTNDSNDKLDINNIPNDFILFIEYFNKNCPNTKETMFKVFFK